jgi:hypothetical protein
LATELGAFQTQGSAAFQVNRLDRVFANVQARVQALTYTRGTTRRQIMATTNIRVDPRTHAQLRELSREEEKSIGK